MAWACSATSNEGLVSALMREKIVRTPAIAAAMRAVDRAWFVPGVSAATAYADSPQPIGFNVTISAPHMHAIMLEILSPIVLSAASGATLNVLDIGSGSGYLTAVLAQLCAAKAAGGSELDWRVWGIEHVEGLQARSLEAVRSHFPHWGDRVRILHGDGQRAVKVLERAVGGASSVPRFDVIHVGAAARSIPPDLVALLSDAGCLVIPVGEEHATQRLLVCRKRADGSVSEEQNCLVSFVPLTSIDRQLNK